MNLTFSDSPIDQMFFENSVMECVNFTIFDDVLFEGSETFTVTLTLLSTGLGVTTGNDTTTVTIIDNEGLLQCCSRQCGSYPLCAV